MATPLWANLALEGGKALLGPLANAIFGGGGEQQPQAPWRGPVQSDPVPSVGQQMQGMPQQQPMQGMPQQREDFSSLRPPMTQGGMGIPGASAINPAIAMAMRRYRGDGNG